jgi:hypothetical protein
VRGRAEELRRSIQECLDALASGSVPITYQDVRSYSFLHIHHHGLLSSTSNLPILSSPSHHQVLKKYTVVNEQLAMLRDQVQRGVLKHLVVHPVMVDGPGVAMALPIQLSSRLTPEMEQDRANITTKASHLLPTSQRAESDEMAACLSRVQSKIDHHNTLIASLVSANGPVDPKGPKRQELDKMTRSIADLVSRAKEEDATANFLLGSEALISKGGERPLGMSKSTLTYKPHPDLTLLLLAI